MKNFSRRNFLKATAAGVVGVSSTHFYGCNNFTKDGGMPRRILGKTGLEVSMLGFGGGSQFQKNPDGKWELLMQRALDLGINLIGE